MKMLKTATLALVAAGTLAGASVPATAAPDYRYGETHGVTWGDQQWNHGDRRWNDNDRYRGYGRGSYGNVYRNDTYYRDSAYRADTWRGRDGRYYCRKSNGTTGLVVGGVAGALLGREIAGSYGDRTLGALLGAAGGALLGREVDRGGSTCR